MTPLGTRAARELARHLAAVAEGPVEADKPLAPHTSYRIGGPTAVWVAPRTEAGVRRALAAVHAAGAPLFVLGRGTNLLVSDRGWPGVTLHLGDNLGGWDFDGDTVRVRAGASMHALIEAAAARGLGGMEPLAGIPGGIGGALRMNAGAFGREIESVTAEVHGFLADGTPFCAGRADLSFGYRQAPELDRVVITSARLRLRPERPETLAARCREILALRAAKQPTEHPSCGSVFKRPPGYYAGALIEGAGLKGERIGGAEISRRHAGFILNVRDATADDVYRLVRLAEQRVFERFGVNLEREVRLVGDFQD